MDANQIKDFMANRLRVGDFMLNGSETSDMGDLQALVDAAVAAERERWREIVEQLIACHDEPTCPAVALAREWLQRPNAEVSGPLWRK